MFILLWINLTWYQATAKLSYNLIFQKHPAHLGASFWHQLESFLKGLFSIGVLVTSNPQNGKHVSSPRAFVNISHFGAVTLLNSVVGLQTKTTKGDVFRIYTWNFLIRQQYQDIWVKSIIHLLEQNCRSKPCILRRAKVTTLGVNVSSKFINYTWTQTKTCDWNTSVGNQKFQLECVHHAHF